MPAAVGVLVGTPPAQTSSVQGLPSSIGMHPPPLLLLAAELLLEAAELLLEAAELLLEAAELLLATELLLLATELLLEAEDAAPPTLDDDDPPAPPALDDDDAAAPPAPPALDEDDAVVPSRPPVLDEDDPPPPPVPLPIDDEQPMPRQLAISIDSSGPIIGEQRPRGTRAGFGAELRDISDTGRSQRRRRKNLHEPSECRPRPRRRPSAARGLRPSLPPSRWRSLKKRGPGAPTCAKKIRSRPLRSAPAQLISTSIVALARSSSASKMVPFVSQCRKTPSMTPIWYVSRNAGKFLAWKR